MQHPQPAHAASSPQPQATAAAGPQVVERLADLAGRYDAVLCDVWGVIHDGHTVFPGVAAALQTVRRAGVPVVLLTNMPRPSTTLPDSLAALGFPRDAWDTSVTSGDTIRAELAQRAPGPMHLLGRTGDLGLWDDLGLDHAELDAAAFVAIAGLSKQRPEPADYLDDLRRARARNLDLLCANPDIRVMLNGRLSWCAGAVAAEYEALGGHVIQTGKPHPAIYARARSVVADLVGRAVPDARILAIGDGLTTDVLGANRAGLDCLFIATGIHGSTLLRQPAAAHASGTAGVGAQPAAVDQARVTATLSAAGLTARWVMPYLA